MNGEDMMGEGKRNWYAACTRSRHEKKIALQLREREVEYFLPLYTSTSEWRDRRKEIQWPLFPGYIFVRSTLEDRLRILTVPGVSKLVSFKGVPSAISEECIEDLKRCVSSNFRTEPHPYLVSGDKVRIRRGALQGLTGIVIRNSSRVRVVISIELIMRSVAVEVDYEDVEPCSPPRPGDWQAQLASDSEVLCSSNSYGLV